ncbi:MAG TPA: sigma-70 family RNA polymerase sigma factor [Polyangiaceae bacterium]|nr:sigma-70 family RNA polymerase sigma factor [Polyangiaceae bacterium]
MTPMTAIGSDSRGRGGAYRAFARYVPRRGQLSSAQQQALFRRLRRRATSAEERGLLRERLVSGTLQIVLQCLQRVGKCAFPAELVQEGVLALARAVDAFVGQDRADFSRFAAVRVMKWLRRVKRKWLNDRVFLVDRPIEELSDNETDDAFVAASQAEREKKLDQLIEQLPPAQQRVLRLRFGIGTHGAQSREAIARALHVERQRVRYLEECGLLTLRRNVERKGARARRWDGRSGSEKAKQTHAE